MEYTDEAEIKNSYDFLDCEQGKNLFAILDFALKDGVHIQEYGKQKDLFLYLRRYYHTLKTYYINFWGLELEEGGSGAGLYYYLKFCPDAKNGIPANHKYMMSNENILIGLLLYKVYYIDHSIELDSLKKFQKMIRTDYPDLKAGIVKALAKAKGEKATLMNDAKIDTCIKNAFEEFNKIKWISIEENGIFEILPAFDRLTREFAHYINDIDAILNDNSNEKLSATS
ncbi:MAG: hypothetical protein LBG15_07475 [Dysgonamonadaceae bacterium]|jgi:hypothetical protein|nr:hypothetical protein [Dysgonamonadaceae bacterium]